MRLSCLMWSSLYVFHWEPLCRINIQYFVIISMCQVFTDTTVDLKKIDCWIFLQQRWICLRSAENCTLRSTTMESHLQVPTQEGKENSFFFRFLFVLFILIVLGLCCCSGFSVVAASGGSSWLQYMGFSLQWLLLLRSTGFSSCGVRGK